MKDFVTALKNLMRRCDEMRALAYRNDGGVSNVFSDRENEKTIDICIGFGKAVAGCSVKDIAACADLIEEARVKVLETNSALNSLMTKNPSTMAFVNIAENWLLEHLVTDPKSILRIAKYLKSLASHRRKIAQA